VEHALKTRGIIYLNVETSLLFAPSFQNFWPRAWLKTSDFFSFVLIISSDQSQSEAKFNLQNLGENKTTMLKTEFFVQMKTSRKVHICLH